MQAFHAPRLAHRWEKMRCDGSAVAGVSQHHGFLHCPRVVAIYESAKPVVAVFAACGMSGVHRFALDEKGVMFRNNRALLAFIVTKFEAEIRRLGEPATVIVGALSLTHDCFVSAAIETRHASRLTEIIFDCAPQGGGYLVFCSRRQIELLVAKKFKSSK